MRKDRILFSLALVLIALAGLVLSYIWEPISVSKRVIEADNPISGLEYDLQIVFRNWSFAEIQLIGAHETCGLGGCVTVPGVPCRIPALSKKSVGITYEARAIQETVEFEREVTIYTNSTIQPKIVFSIRGRVLPFLAMSEPE